MIVSSQTYAATLTKLLTDTVRQPPSAMVPLEQAVGRRLAADVLTKYPSPLFDNSQMDGYGIAQHNLVGGDFRIGPDVPAGTDPAEIYPQGVNGYGHDIAVPIMTGAKIPDDVVAIIPVELAEPATFGEVGDAVHLPVWEFGKFIRKAGGDMPANTLLATAGRRIDATLIATAASQGISKLLVKVRPRIGVISGGDEVVTGSAPGVAKIFDANTPLVRGLAQTHGMDIVAIGSTTDSLADFRGVVDQMILEHNPDVILTSGGISEGKYEVVRQLLEGLETFWVGKVAQQPGGPQGYGVYGSTVIIAIPGNPISTLVSTRMLVLPALWEAFGAGFQPVKIQARINHAITGIQGRTQYRRGIVGVQDTEVVAQIQGFAESHLLAQAVGTNALIEVPPMAKIQAGQTVTAHLFADSHWDAEVPGVAPVNY